MNYTVPQRAIRKDLEDNVTAIISNRNRGAKYLRKKMEEYCMIDQKLETSSEDSKVVVKKQQPKSKRTIVTMRTRREQMIIELVAKSSNLQFLNYQRHRKLNVCFSGGDDEGRLFVRQRARSGRKRKVDRSLSVTIILCHLFLALTVPLLLLRSVAATKPSSSQETDDLLLDSVYSPTRAPLAVDEHSPQQVIAKKRELNPKLESRSGSTIFTKTNELNAFLDDMDHSELRALAAGKPISDLFQPKQIALGPTQLFVSGSGQKRPADLGLEADEEQNDRGRRQLDPGLEESQSERQTYSECALILQRTYVKNVDGEQKHQLVPFGKTEQACISYKHIDKAVEQAKHKLKFRELAKQQKKFSKSQRKPLVPFEVIHSTLEPPEDLVAAIGEINMATTQIIADQFDLSNDELLNGLPLIDMSKTKFWSLCPLLVRGDIKCELTRFRTITGHCNNLKHPTWGAAMTPFSRYLPPLHPDGIWIPRKSIVTEITFDLNEGHREIYSNIASTIPHPVFHNYIHEHVHHQLHHEHNGEMGAASVKLVRHTHQMEVPPLDLERSELNENSDARSSNHHYQISQSPKRPFVLSTTPISGAHQDQLAAESLPRHHKTRSLAHELPSARLVTSIVHRDVDLPNHDFSILFMSWGQLLDHDMTRAAQPPSSIKCCGQEEPKHKLCLPIQVPANDPFYGKFDVHCLEFRRTLAGIRPNCVLGPRVHQNTITSPIDANFVYGSSQALADALRLFKGGRLRDRNWFHREGLKPLLPAQDKEPDLECIARPKDLFCFLAGDVRVNEQTHLTVLHTLYMREHNKLASKLAELNSHWDDERIYQETRHIMAAGVQHVMINEYIPLLIGKKMTELYNLTSHLDTAGGEQPMHDLNLDLNIHNQPHYHNQQSYWHGYDPSVTTSVSNSFAAAAFRQGHTFVQGSVERYNKFHEFVASEKLRYLFKQPFLLYQPGVMDELTAGMINQPAQSYDPFISEDISGHLFQPPKGKFGHDLPAINLQRGREQGLPGYNLFREWCGLPRAETFDQLEPYLTNHTAYQYSRLYRHVDDIDLWSGGVSERKLPGAAIGPTFACIIARQFSNTRRGDRFWYENPGLPSSFTPEQLAEIRKISLAKLLCSNSDDLPTIQRWALRMAHPVLNPRIPCSQLPELDLQFWQEEYYFRQRKRAGESISSKKKAHSTATIPSSEGPLISTSSISAPPSSSSSSLAQQPPTTTTVSSSSSSSGSSSSSSSSSISSIGSGYLPSSTSIAPSTPASTAAASISSLTSHHQNVQIATSTKLPPSSASPANNDGEHHKHHNQSPVTLYSAEPHPFRPDRMATIDLIIVVIYLCLLISTSISTMLRTRKSNKRKAALAGNKGQITNNFLAAGRKMNWFTVGASIFASNLGSEHFIGLSGSAAANGISVAAFEMNALLILQLATWIFLPVLIVSKISTLPEYMSKRFGGKRIRTYLAILSILLYIFTKISVNLFSGGIFIQQAVGWNLYSSAMFILALTCVMTLTGGLKGAMMIDNLQAVVMTIGASIVSAKALVAIGGWEGLKHRYSLAVPTKVPANLTHCAQPNPRAFQMLRPWDDRDMPWIGFIVGQTPASIWYWAADQMMVQRFLSARSLAHVQGSSVFAGYLKILPLIFMVIPGMISRCLYTDEVGCIDPVECQKYCQSSVSCSNTAYPRLVLELMPMGARGMMVAAMVAALMGDLCNVFNSASALFSCDIYPLFRKHSTQKEQETAGRVFVMCLVLASIMWIPVIQEMQGGQLFIYIQAVAAMFAPPIAGVYICAVLWKRTNESGAFWALMIGFALGVSRMTMSFMYKEPSCGQHIDERPWLLKHVHYMYYAAFLFWVTIGSTILISYYTKPPAPFRLIRTTYWTRFDTNIRKDDKNVFEMKYSGAITNSNSTLSIKRDDMDSQRSMLPKTSQEDLGGSLSEGFMSSKSSQQRLFTIEEQQEKKAADLSSVIVDINKAAAVKDSTAATTNKTIKPDSMTMPNVCLKRSGIASLQHQASLSASASAAVGAASEAGKFIANKLANEVNLKGAREMVMAAASHLTGTPNTRIKFQNLDGEDDDDDYERDDNIDGDETIDAGSTMDDEDEDEDEDFGMKRKQKRRSQSVLSAALSSYKQKQKGGYKKAAYDDNFDEDDDEDDDDEKINLNRSASSKRSKKRSKSSDRSYVVVQAQEMSSSTDDRQTPTQLGLIGRDFVDNDEKGAKKAFKMAERSGKTSSSPAAASVFASSSTRRSTNQRGQSKKTKQKGKQMYEEELDDDLDQESGRTYKCLDNSVSLLIKTRLEETMLRIALIAIVFVAIGIFILFSLPPTSPPQDVVDILIKN